MEHQQKTFDSMNEKWMKLAWMILLALGVTANDAVRHRRHHRLHPRPRNSALLGRKAGSLGI